MKEKTTIAWSQKVCRVLCQRNRKSTKERENNCLWSKVHQVKHGGLGTGSFVLISDVIADSGSKMNFKVYTSNIPTQIDDYWHSVVSEMDFRSNVLSPSSYPSSYFNPLPVEFLQAAQGLFLYARPLQQLRLFFKICSFSFLFPFH